MPTISPMPSKALQRTHIRFSLRAVRALWFWVWLLLYRPSPRVFHAWRRMILRCFGAHIGAGAHPYPSAKIWAPWNLTMGPNSCIADNVDVYSVSRIEIGENATISQYCYLCTASHDHNSRGMPLVAGPIIVAAHAWLTADVFVGPGVTIGEGAVVGARSGVYRDVAAWKVVAGNPAREIGDRNRAEILATR